MGKIYSHVFALYSGQYYDRAESAIERSPEIHNLASGRRKRVNQQKYETRFVAARGARGKLTGVS